MIHELAEVDVRAAIGKNCTVWRWTHIDSMAIIGDNVMIGQGCYVSGSIGTNTRIQNGVYVWDGVHIETDCFIGPNVAFTNSKYPMTDGGIDPTFIGSGTKIGANATILPVKIGKNVMIGAGAVITRNVPDGVTVINIDEIISPLPGYVEG